MRSNSLSQRPQFPAPPRGSGKNTQVGRRRGRGAARGDAEAALTQDAVELFEPTPYPPNFRHPLVGAGKFPSRAAPRHYRPGIVSIAVREGELLGRARPQFSATPTRGKPVFPRVGRHVVRVAAALPASASCGLQLLGGAGG